MKLREILILGMAVLLVAMMVCPAIAAVQAAEPKSKSHCSEETPAAPDNTGLMLCCCDQSALSVAAVHAPEDWTVLAVISLSSDEEKPVSFAVKRDHFPYLKTGDHLSRLSVLRL